MSAINVVSIIENLYQRFATQREDVFITEFDNILKINAKEIIETQLKGIQKSQQFGNNAEKILLKTVLDHYNEMVIIYNHIIKKVRAREIQKFSKFCDQIAKHPELFADFDFKSAYDVICPKPPGAGGNKQKCKSKPKKTKPTTEKPKKTKPTTKKQTKSKPKQKVAA